MEIAGQQELGASRDEVWAALNDPAVLQRSIPGCESLTKEGDGFAAIVSVKIGPIGARFKGSVSIENPDPPTGYTLVGQGQGGMAGSARGQARVELAKQGSGTLLSYTVEAEVGGRLAQLGGPVIEATARQLAGRFFANFEREVSNGGAPVAAEPPSGSGEVATHPGAGPWPWLSAIAIAVVAGYLLGRSDAAYASVPGLIALAVICALAGRASRNR